MKFGLWEFFQITGALAFFIYGMKVMSEPSTSEVAAVGVFINAGSRHEKIENTGEAHFLEHLHFKGSKTRSRYGLETEVENRGH